MTMAGDPQQRIDAYLGRLRGRLRGMNREEVRDIAEELRTHIMDKAAAAGEMTVDGIDAALAALGSPEELANQYITDNLLARAEVSRWPVQIVKSLFRWASLSAAGFFVLLGSVVGYFLRSCFHAGRGGEVIPSANRWFVDLSGQYRHPRALLSNGVRECPGWRQGCAGLVDRTDRMDRGLRVGDVDHAQCALVGAAIPEIPCAWSGIIQSDTGTGGEKWTDRSM